MKREIQLSDLITVRNENPQELITRNGHLSDFIVKKEKHGIKLLTTDQQDVWEIIGCGRKYQYRSATWAEKRYDRMVKIYENKV